MVIRASPITFSAGMASQKRTVAEVRLCATAFFRRHPTWTEEGRVLTHTELLSLVTYMVSRDESPSKVDMDILFILLLFRYLKSQ